MSSDMTVLRAVLQCGKECIRGERWSWQVCHAYCDVLLGIALGATTAKMRKLGVLGTDNHGLAELAGHAQWTTRRSAVPCHPAPGATSPSAAKPRPVGGESHPRGGFRFTSRALLTVLLR